MFLRFLASGGLSTLLDVAFFWLLKHVLPVDIAFAVSYSLCVIIRYFIDARLTFATERMHLRQFLAYFLANLAVMYLGLLTFDLIHAHHFPDMVCKVLTIPVTVVSGFVIMRLVVFRKKDKEPT